MKVTFAIKDGKSFEFDIWNGRPQLPRAVIDRTTRLGGKKTVMSVIRREAVVTSSTAYAFFVDRKKADEFIKSLSSNLGTKGTFTDEAGHKITNFYIIDYTYNLRVTSDSLKPIIVTFSIACSTDEE